MAENKKSFILYANQEHLFEMLSDAKAGKLIKQIFSYVNDKDPESPKDQLVLMAFETIKSVLKRDLKNWETRKGERSESGRLGNLKRWHIDLYDQVIKDEINIETAEIIAKNRLATTAIAKIAVNDSVIVIDSVSEKSDLSPVIYSIEHCLTVAMNDPRWVKANKVTEKDLQDFNALLEKRGIYEKNPMDYKTHYANWKAGGGKEEGIVVGMNDREKATLEKLRNAAN